MAEGTRQPPPIPVARYLSEFQFFPSSIVKINLIIFLWILNGRMNWKHFSITFRRLIPSLDFSTSNRFAARRKTLLRTRCVQLCWERRKLLLVLIELIKFCGMQKKAPLFMRLMQILTAPWQASLIKYLTQQWAPLSDSAESFYNLHRQKLFQLHFPFESALKTIHCMKARFEGELKIVMPKSAFYNNKLN